MGTGGYGCRDAAAREWGCRGGDYEDRLAGTQAQGGAMIEVWIGRPGCGQTAPNAAGKEISVSAIWWDKFSL